MKCSALALISYRDATGHVVQVHLNSGEGSTAALRHLAEGIISAQVEFLQGCCIVKKEWGAGRTAGSCIHVVSAPITRCLFPSKMPRLGADWRCHLLWRLAYQGALEDKLAHVTVERDAYAAQLADLRRYQSSHVAGASHGLAPA